MPRCIFRSCVRVLKLGYNGVVVVGVFGGQFFPRRRRGSCFFLFFWGGRLLVAFLDTLCRNHPRTEEFFLLLLLINKISPRRFLLLLFGDECRRRQWRRWNTRPRCCVSRFHPLSFSLSLFLSLSLSLSFDDDDLNCVRLLVSPLSISLIKIKISAVRPRAYINRLSFFLLFERHATTIK